MQILIIYIKILFIYFRGKGGRERNISVQEIYDQLPLTCPLMGTWPATQVCALTGNQTSKLLVCRPELHPEPQQPGLNAYL